MKNFLKQLSTLHLYLNSFSPKINNIDTDNDPLTKFMNTLSDVEKNGSFNELPKDKQYGKIKAIAEVYQSAIDNPLELLIKMHSMIMNTLRHHNIDNLTMNVSFSGSKLQVQQENFDIQFIKQEFISKQHNDITNDFFQAKKQSIKEKLNHLIENKDTVLSVYTDTHNTFKDNGDISSVLTSQLLTVMNLISSFNMENYQITEMKEHQTDTTQLYSLFIKREEVNYTVAPNKSKKFS